MMIIITTIIVIIIIIIIIIILLLIIILNTNNDNSELIPVVYHQFLSRLYCEYSYKSYVFPPLVEFIKYDEDIQYVYKLASILLPFVGHFIHGVKHYGGLLIYNVLKNEEGNFDLIKKHLTKILRGGGFHFALASEILIENINKEKIIIKKDLLIKPPPLPFTGLFSYLFPSEQQPIPLIPPHLTPNPIFFSKVEGLYYGLYGSHGYEVIFFLMGGRERYKAQVNAFPFSSNYLILSYRS